MTLWHSWHSLKRYIDLIISKLHKECQSATVPLQKQRPLGCSPIRRRSIIGPLSVHLRGNPRPLTVQSGYHVPTGTSYFNNLTL